MPPPVTPSSSSGEPPRDPWFRRSPVVTLAVIGLLYVAVLLLRLVSDSSEHYSLFYVLPVALAATAFGLRGGVLASLLAVALVVAGVLDRDLELSPGGWATRVVPLLLLGVLLGRAVDRARAAEEQRRQLEVAALLHREAIEINDSLIQRMSAAKWSLEAGQIEAGLEALSAAVSEAQRLVSDLIRRAEMGERAEPVPGAAEAADEHISDAAVHDPQGADESGAPGGLAAAQGRDVARPSPVPLQHPEGP